MKVFARLFFVILSVGNVMTAALPGRTKVELSKVLKIFFIHIKYHNTSLFIQWKQLKETKRCRSRGG